MRYYFEALLLAHFLFIEERILLFFYVVVKGGKSWANILRRIDGAVVNTDYKVIV